MKKIIAFCFSIITFTNIIAQNSTKVSAEINWEEKLFTSALNPDLEIKYSSFTNATFDKYNPQLPRYTHNLKLDGTGTLDIKITPLKTSSIEIDPSKNMHDISSNYEATYNITNARERYQGNISVLPIRRSKTGYEKLDQFVLEIKYIPSYTSILRDPELTTSSILREGTFFKIAINEDGVYKIDGKFLADNFDIDLQGINSSDLQLYGNIGGRLPKANAEKQPDDLSEIPLLMNAGDSFGSNDFFTFYAEGADRWSYDNTTQQYSNQKNVYDNNNYVFLRIDGANGKRIQQVSSNDSPTYESDEFDFLQIYEDDRTNLLGANGSTEGTGKEWYGDYFSQENERNYSDKFDITDINTDEEARIKMKFAARGEDQTFTFLRVNAAEFSQKAFGTNLSDIEADYAKKVFIDTPVNLQSSGNDISIEYQRSTSNDEGWLDYIQLEYRKKITNKYPQIRVSDKKSIDQEVASLSVPQNVEVWNVTNMNETSQFLPKNGKITYEPNNQLYTFFFVKNDNYLSPTAVEKVENQNLHSIETPEMVIVYHSEFEDAALRLAQHRRDYSQLDVVAVDINKIYNEFSSGRKDPTALRDFSRMIYSRNLDYKYLLLIGDGSYDFRNITPNLLDHNFIPVYETEESLDPINGFPSDDYYALLSDNEGGNLQGALDVAVGRLPVTSGEMANNVVDKIINYDTNKDTYADWRLKIGFAADDEDTNLHLNQADAIAEKVEKNDKDFNQSKFYFDSYVQESTPGGDRYPAASEAINSAVQKGLLILNYLGHGGPKGWSQERVLKVSDIETWNNADYLPLLITATCSFTGYDDPSIVSAGEAAMQKANGGVIALFTTVRAVYSSENDRLTNAVFDVLLKKKDGLPQRLGDIITAAKNENADAINVLNDRKFSLIGDPAQRLALPTLNIQTLTINDQSVDQLDTLSALEKVTITGQITDQNGSVATDFNGKVYPTIYDKESTLTTLANDSRSYERDFGVYRNILFKGQATVTNGQFSFTFVMPKDINYEFGKGRISYYAFNDVDQDAAGNFTKIIVGGTDPNAVADNEGPEVSLFMNDQNFAFGGSTDDSPTLLALLSDDLGINVSGTSIGHDITAILDDDEKNTFILNEFYEADIDNYTSGKVRFPFKDLEPGPHSITLKAWDVSNNSAESRLEFVVVNQDGDLLRNVYNYPNPFSTSTTFLFEHDLVGTDLEVFIDIYTISGKLVKTINENIFTTGYSVRELGWNGKDDYETQLAKGLYLYKIRVFSNELGEMRESGFEKMVKI